MEQFRRFPIFLLAFLAAAWTAVPGIVLRAANVSAVVTESEDTEEDARTDVSDTVATAGRSHGHHPTRPARGRELLPLPSAPPADRFHALTARPVADTVPALRNGLGTFYRC